MQTPDSREGGRNNPQNGTRKSCASSLAETSADLRIGKEMRTKRKRLEYNQFRTIRDTTEVDFDTILFPGDLSETEDRLRNTMYLPNELGFCNRNDSKLL